VSARPEIPPEDAVTVHVDGREFRVRKGAMIIEVTDGAGISVPRFCYHKKLSVAANCRMCMVEVENSPKPLPACATPVADGMKVYTRSDVAQGAQKAVMEFLLINHPLDCPICDQGGECELQDLALGYGRDVSRFTEKKRVVKDKYIGPLIATDMTRCIHCTRCIRMLQEVAGKMELGATGRGENMEIGTYIEQSLESELSGNIIDVCPVGALTSRPFRFRARAWELTQHAGIAPHDSMGSNIYMHTLRGRVMRVVPRENEEINEVWLSDRDRFSYEGLYSDDRLAAPMLKVEGRWEETDWDTALHAAIDGLRSLADKSGADQIGMLVSPTATLEEMYLAQAIARGLGTHNIDHRLRRSDPGDQDGAPLAPLLGMSLEQLEAVNAALVVGANPRKEQPIAGHRLRKAALAGARIMFVNPVDYEFLFPVHTRAVVPPSQMPQVLAAICACFPHAVTRAPEAVRSMIAGVRPDAGQQAMAIALKEADTATVLLGNTAAAHPQASLIRALAGVIAEASGAVLGFLPESANSVGGWLAGTVPHRGPAGDPLATPGMDTRAMCAQPRKGYVLLNVEPEYDCNDGAGMLRAVAGADFVVSLGPWAGASLKASADVLLPIGAFAETSGTFVNAEGRWQSFAGAVPAYADSRPGWKVLRVLGNLLQLDGFEYTSTEEIRDELRRRVDAASGFSPAAGNSVAEVTRGNGLERIGDVPIYAADPLVRRAASLQQTPDATGIAARMCAAQAEKSGLEDGTTIKVLQDDHVARVALAIDERVPEGCIWLPTATRATAELGPDFGTVTVEKI
jgi:NADH-quinone oxidoreductase subunit G